MKPRLFVISLLLIVSLVFPGTVLAARGGPDSSEFGTGARIYPSGPAAIEALQQAVSLKLDWIVIDLDWAARWPDSTQQPNLADLDQIMAAAAQYKLAVMFSLRNAPAWALTPDGPSPDQTAWFIANLARRYSQSLQAVELYPGANTSAGWGATPNAAAYVRLVQAARTALQETGLPVFIVAGGLTPVAASDGQVDDITFLSDLYANGLRDTAAVLSLAFADVTGSPLVNPTPTEHRVLRHYEEIRQVMLDNGHADGLLWITSLNPPSGRIAPTDNAFAADPAAQAQWLAQSYGQASSQLYIGMAAFNSLNAPLSSKDSPFGIILVQSNENQHPFYAMLKTFTAKNGQLPSLSAQYNRPQSKAIYKNRSSS
ncbi:MAG TPA: hypothetical protein PKW33_05545 [Anaerolineaceae bacterium]|nr:hypothetical protein [Anaerolineaceae bacterium]HPN51030.1 hypothetical protein [Anaerolineaceae bacterium]